MEELSRKILNKNKSDNVELVISDSSALALVYEKEKLLYPFDSASSSVVIRVTLSDGRCGVASSSRLSDWESVLKTARKFALVSEKDKNFKGIPVKDEDSVVKLYDPSLEKLDVDWMKEQCDIMKHIVDENKQKVQELSVSKSIASVFFANSNGVAKTSRLCAVSGALSVVLNEVSGFSSQSFSHSPELGKIAVEAVEECKLGQSKGSVKTGKYNVLFDYNAIEDILSSTFLSSVNGFNVLKNRSFYSSKLNEKVASSQLTVTDDATIDYALNSYPSDAEGVKSQKTVLIDNGILKNFIYDYYTANLVSKKSTGNCSSIALRPAIDSSNVVISPGKKRREDIIAGMKKGIILSEISGAHMINPVSGDFSNDMIKAYYIEDGVIKHSLDSGMISGNVYSMLSNVAEIAKEQKQRGIFISPSILFKNLQIIS